jgi:hypothetical protein
MNLFELLFILAVVVSAASLVVAAVFALRGRGAQSLGILKLFVIGSAAYLAAAAAVAFFQPQRVIPMGEAWCFDDWCLTAENVSRTPSASQIAFQVELRISSRAGRVTQRAHGAWIYLIDDQGHTYPPEPDPSAVPLYLLLQPGESVTTRRVFKVPVETRHLGLITGHGGPYCGPMDLLIIGGGGCLFHRPAMIRIQ